MTPRELEIAQHAAGVLRKRHLMKDYHIPFWDLEEIPAPFIDDLMQADAVEAAVLDDKAKGH